MALNIRTVSSLGAAARGSPDDRTLACHCFHVKPTVPKRCLLGLVKLQVHRADIYGMDSTTCAQCGSDLLDEGARFCSACGTAVPERGLGSAGDRDGVSDAAPAANIPEQSDGSDDDDHSTDDNPTVEDDSEPAAEVTSGSLSKYAFEVPLRARLTDEQWQYATWGAIAAGAVAVVALIAVVFGLLSRSDDTAASALASATTSTTTMAEPPAGGVIERPLTIPSVVENPRYGESALYLQDGVMIGVRLTMDRCERRSGMLTASGSIRNETMVGQTLDYHVGVELTRRVVGTPLASLEATVESLGPGETAEWGVEAVSTKTVNLACDITTLTVTPPENP